MRKETAGKGVDKRKSSMNVSNFQPLNFSMTQSFYQWGHPEQNVNVHVFKWNISDASESLTDIDITVCFFFTIISVENCKNRIPAGLQPGSPLPVRWLVKACRQHRHGPHANVIVSLAPTLAWLPASVDARMTSITRLHWNVLSN